MAWIPHPDDIITVRATGVGDMGSVTDENSVARFSLPGGGKFVLIWAKVKFTGGTGSAALTLKSDHRETNSLYDFDEAAAWTGMGTDETPKLDWLIPVEEYPRYVYQAGDVLVWTWTNPDAANMRWTIEMGLTDATIRNNQTFPAV
ncbi:hypothetical protein LCGC14_1030460 [marine sediment metagenome]|uniref:Uncharacterized protein n=1 Tax=marine sediment metagenome TaxID=412755 RepID=A0A0F9MUR0_9ZZZZ